MRRVSIIIAFVSVFFWNACSKQKQETAASVPGDNLDLYAALDVFKSSKNPEAFEKALNDNSNKINNLDLNVDGKVDYIKIIDHKEGDAHAITLRALVSKSESHDVAVIEIEKTGEHTANIQIIGDEDVYGKDFIIEPKSEKEKAGFMVSTVAVNVCYWPCVTYMYSPAYVVYVSPWEYEYYPVWYDPWAPVAYEVYYPAVYHYHTYYYPVNELRFERAHAIYHERRVVSGYVQKHNYGAHGNNRNVAPRGNDYYGGQRGNHNDNYAPRGNNNANPKGGDFNKSNQRGQQPNVNPKGGDYHQPNQRGNQNANPKGGNYNQPNQHGNQNANPKGGNYNQPNQRGNQNASPKGGNYNQPNQRGNQNANPKGGNYNQPNQRGNQNPNPKGGYNQGSPKGNHSPQGSPSPRPQQQQGGNHNPKGTVRPR